MEWNFCVRLLLYATISMPWRKSRLALTSHYQIVSALKKKKIAKKNYINILKFCQKGRQTNFLVALHNISSLQLHSNGLWSEWSPSTRTQRVLYYPITIQECRRSHLNVVANMFSTQNDTLGLIRGQNLYKKTFEFVKLVNMIFSSLKERLLYNTLVKSDKRF